MMKQIFDRVLFVLLSLVIGYYGWVFAQELLKSDMLIDISKFITVLWAAFVIGALFGVSTMFIKSLMQNSKLNGYKRELEKESDRISESRKAEKTTKTKSSEETQQKAQTGEKEKPETQHNETHRIQKEYHGEQAADNADIVSIAADELMRSGSSEVRDKVSEELEKDGKKKPRKPRYI